MVDDEDYVTTRTEEEEEEGEGEKSLCKLHSRDNWNCGLLTHSNRYTEREIED